MASTPSILEQNQPAAKPERKIDIQPEDIQLGTDLNKSESKGKSQLKRPRSASGVGLSV